MHCKLIGGAKDCDKNALLFNSMCIMYCAMGNVQIVRDANIVQCRAN